MPATQHILLVGHCAYDSGSLKSLAQQAVPGAEVVRINDQAALDEKLADASLLLVNRVLEGSFDAGGSGIELIRQLAARADAPAAMLISNYEDAQAQARDAGALPGFGKSDIAKPDTAQRLAAAAKQKTSA